MNNKGYSLLSILLVLMMVSSFALLTLKNKQELNLEHVSFMKEYLEKQSDSLVNNIENTLDNYNISFNKLGHVNHAQSITIGGHTIIIHLGNGYVSVQ